MGAGQMSAPVVLPEENPFAMVKRAASGDLDAQRMLAGEAAGCLECGDLEGFYGGLVYARMAAAQGDASDTGRLISLLPLVARIADPNDEDYHASLGGQFLALASVGLDQIEGEDSAARAEGEVNYLEAVAASNPKTIEMAKGWEALLKAAQGEG
jgi:hypothetical protein